MDGEALTVIALSTWREHDRIDQSLDHQQRPNSCTQLSDELPPFHAGAFVKVHHSHVPMDADESEEYGAAVEM